MAAEAQGALAEAVTRLVRQARRFDPHSLPPDLARKLARLTRHLDAPAPADAAERDALASAMVSLASEYGRGVWRRVRDGREQVLDIAAVSRVMADSRDANELEGAWVGWHAVGAPMRDRYARFVDLANGGAREMGYADVGALWRSAYDVGPEDFSAEVERLWAAVAPLYRALHAYVRSCVRRAYRDVRFPATGLIPAHLLGNLWAQDWGNIYQLVAPADTNRDPRVMASAFDLTAILRAHGVDEREMVRYGERFFTSLGFAPLPSSFWRRSLFRKPADRDVVSHASAWNVDLRDDLRLKMCIEITGDDFVTIHHELGHLIYDRAYSDQPTLFRGGAHDGFHEAIGDAVALSITPAYLREVGLLRPSDVPPTDIEILLRIALDKIAFLPFGLLVDRWRWQVFSGEVEPARYNAAWWDLRRRYQGVSEPVTRTERDFDPGAKYHVPANTPYIRYFLARILQFQFHRALCRLAGQTGPIHACSIYGSTAAGAGLARMLAMGASQPWPDALEALTGDRQMDATALLEYFTPLTDWLDERNRGVDVGWEDTAITSG